VNIQVRAGDCVEVLATLDADTVGTVVCDPPYGLEFLGAEWDRLQGYCADTEFKGFVLPRQRQRNVKCPECSRWVWDKDGRACACGGVTRYQTRTMQDWHEGWLSEVFRVLRPGGRVKAFSATRTFHRLAAAMESVGFEDLTVEAWAYGSGFPKSKSVPLFLDKLAGATGNRGRAIPTASTYLPGEGKYAAGKERLTSNIVPPYEPITPEAVQWDGWGTGLKPAWEPFVVGRKPAR